MKPFVIRRWLQKDEAQLQYMILNCLDVNAQSGADMLATPKNALALVHLGMTAVAAGDPCYVAEASDEGLVAYTLWLGMPNALGLDYDGKVLYGLGTFVRFDYRKAGVSREIRDVAEAEARRLGYTKVVGVAYHEAGLKSVLSRGYTVAGQHVEKVL